MKCHRYTFHVEPDLAMHVHALGQWLLQHERKRWCFVVSADALGEEVHRRASRLLQSQGGVDLGRFAGASRQQDYQQAIERLARAHAEAVFVALPGEDLRRFMGQYQKSGLAAWLAGAPLDMVAMWKVGSAQRSGVWATSWYHQLERYSARELNGRFMRRFGKPAEASAWVNWAAVKLATEGALRSASVDPPALVNYLEGPLAFDGHKGKALTFRSWNHQLRQPLYIVKVKARDARPENAWDLFEVLGEMPAPAAPGKRVSELLDTLGESQDESRCRLEAQ